MHATASDKMNPADAAGARRATLADCGCQSPSHFNRRTLLKAASFGGVAWLTPVAELLARQDERAPRGKPPKSVIVLWLDGGPSQLETFDPHPGTTIGGETKAIKTALKGVEIGSGLVHTAEVMDSLSIVRSVTSKEGDHERATYNAKTGFRPDPTLVHPAIGAVICHQLPDNVEIPRHVSILASSYAARGGYLGDRYDAFQVGDPQGKIPDVEDRVPVPRVQQRAADLNVVEAAFARRRLVNLDAAKTLHRVSMDAARKMMSSDQLKAFDVSGAAAAERAAYGDSAFGRGCLAARRLIEVGVRCVEVTLSGWDTHVNNYPLQMSRIAELDAPLAALTRDLKERGLFDSTILVCGGEFGRTPRINSLEGRDHWPHGFSIVLAGGGVRSGVVYGATSATPRFDEPDLTVNVEQPRDIADIHATILQALGIDFTVELDTPVGRPMAISKGQPIRELLA